VVHEVSDQTASRTFMSNVNTVHGTTSSHH